MGNKRNSIGAVVVLLAAGGFSPSAAAEDLNPISRMSLEYLMNVEVTTVSKQPESIQNAAASVHVLRREEIRRAGATTIPDALRLVPGVNVARINANSWAISIRGLRSRFGNKLLIMIDGRSVYSPLFSGIFWDRNNIPIDDIDRIEVVRGPGGTLWGANAVNGVINIITRHSGDTQGRTVEASVGTEERGSLMIRQGDTIGDTATYRLSAEADAYDDSRFADGSSADDAWENGQAHLRVDWVPTADDEVLFEAGINSVAGGGRYTAPLLTPPYSETRSGDVDRYGAYMLGQWARQINARNRLSLQGYVDHRYMDIDTPIAEETRTTSDLQVQHDFALRPDLDLTWGAGYRTTRYDVTADEFSFVVDPESDTFDVYNAFIQASKRLYDDRIELTVGAKIESNSISGTAIQPSARALWKVTPDHSVWTSVSQADRTPSIIETNMELRNAIIPPNTPQNPTSLPLAATITGDDDLGSEQVTAYEAGYRGRISRDLTVDLSGFVNRYEGLLLDTDTGTTRLNTDFGVPFLEVPLTINEQADGTVYGAEVSASWQASPNWQLRGGYSWVHEDLDAPPRSGGNSPSHQVSVQSLYDISPTWRFDTVLRYADELENTGTDAYVNLDARLSWSPTPDIELAITGRNLLFENYEEYGVERVANPQPLASQVERSLTATFTLKF
ncbi:MAG: TonB-dependent receptor [Thalassobaculaceae bacterium]